MTGAVVAWVMGLSLAGVIRAGAVVGRRQKCDVDLRQYALPTDDVRVAERTELQREHVGTLVNRQQVDPGGV
jgi:hypothetical protein